MVVFPRAEASLEVLVAHLGRISLTNQPSLVRGGWDPSPHIPADAAQAELRIRDTVPFWDPWIRDPE